jgi:hypothetical protein
MGAIDPLRTFSLRIKEPRMAPLTVYSFRDWAFSPRGDTHVCIVEREALKAFMSPKEISAAFSGHVVYRRGVFARYVGVWGRRNGKRLRRFLSERGATVAIVRCRPTGARIAIFETRATRERIRDIAMVDA